MPWTEVAVFVVATTVDFSELWAEEPADIVGELAGIDAEAWEIVAEEGEVSGPGDWTTETVLDAAVVLGFVGEAAD